MHPTYFLLRNNQESGPYTIDELLLQRLTTTDLVWVQGRTNAWCHPSELEELTVTYSINREKLRELDPAPDPQKSFRRNRLSGRGEIESRAEEIRKSILGQAIISGSRRLEIQEDYSPTSFKIPEERINLVVHKKRIKVPNPQFLAICFMLLFIAGAWFGRDVWLHESRFLDSVAKPVKEKSTVIIPEKKQSPVPLSTETITRDTSLNTADSMAIAKETSPIAHKPVVKKQTTTGIQDSNAINKSGVTVADAIPIQKEPVIKKDSESLNLELKKAETEIVVAEKNKSNDTKNSINQDSIASTKTEKKRGFFGRLFKKKKDE
jgi:hypothetical protein